MRVAFSLDNYPDYRSFVCNALRDRSIPTLVNNKTGTCPSSIHLPQNLHCKTVIFNSMRHTVPLPSHSAITHTKIMKYHFHRQLSLINNRSVSLNWMHSEPQVFMSVFTALLFLKCRTGTSAISRGAYAAENTLLLLKTSQFKSMKSLLQCWVTMSMHMFSLNEMWWLKAALSVSIDTAAASEAGDH